MIEINKEFYENRTRTMTIIFWKVEITCMSSLDHSFLVILAEKKRLKREKDASHKKGVTGTPGSP